MNRKNYLIAFGLIAVIFVYTHPVEAKTWHRCISPEFYDEIISLHCNTLPQGGLPTLGCASQGLWESFSYLDEEGFICFDYELR